MSYLLLLQGLDLATWMLTRSYGSLTNRVFLKISRVKIREWSSLIHVFHANSSSKTKQLTRLLGELLMNLLLLKWSTRNFGR